MIDQEYMRLYRRYVKALRAYENMLEKRKQSRARWKERRKQPPKPRRPIGSPPPKEERSTAPVKTEKNEKPKFRQIYLGKILGWAKVVGVTPPLPPDYRPLVEHDIFDRTQLALYWNAKLYYQKCKKEYFEYALRGPKTRKGRRPTTGYRKNRARASGHIADAAYAQMTGDQEASEKAIKNGQMEQERACYELWDNYRDNPEDLQVLSDLIQYGLVDAQLLGMSERRIVIVIQNEINRLDNSGKFK